MARIVGRKVYPSDLAERRVLQGLGVDLIRAPRSVNPYILARRLRRAAHGNLDVLFLSDVAARRPVKEPEPLPGPDTTDLSAHEP